MAVIEVAVDTVRAICFKLTFAPGQNSSALVVFNKQANEAYPFQIDPTGYTMTIKDSKGVEVKSLTVGNGITIDTTNSNAPSMSFDFGSDLLNDNYTISMKANNYVPPYDIIYTGTLNPGVIC